MAANEEIELELEALESIYVDELVKLPSGALRIRIDPEDEAEAAEFDALRAAEQAKAAAEAQAQIEEDKTGRSLQKPQSQAPKKVDQLDEPEEDPDAPDPIVTEPAFWLEVTYPPAYPDEIPGLALLGNPLILDADREKMLDGLKEVAQESLGMAMVFTLASHMRESLSSWIKKQLEATKAEENERREAEIEAENVKFRGTVVTKERFVVWHTKFIQEIKTKAQAAEDEKVRAMSAKEREEYRRFMAKPSGRELFTKPGAVLDSSDEVGDAEAKEIDWSLYDRATRDRERSAWEDQQELQQGVERLDTSQFDDD